MYYLYNSMIRVTSDEVVNDHKNESTVDSLQLKVEMMTITFNTTNYKILKEKI